MYKTLFGSRTSRINLMSGNDKHDIYWFLTSVVMAVDSGKGRNESRYTHSDEAFVLGMLKFHKNKWEDNPDPQEKRNG